jgi:hypothetical protein
MSKTQTGGWFSSSAKEPLGNAGAVRRTQPHPSGRIRVAGPGGIDGRRQADGMRVDASGRRKSERKGKRPDRPGPAGPLHSTVLPRNCGAGFMSDAGAVTGEEQAVIDGGRGVRDITRGDGPSQASAFPGSAWRRF